MLGQRLSGYALVNVLMMVKALSSHQSAALTLLLATLLELAVVFSMMSPKPIDYYRGLTSGGSYLAILSQDQAATVLKAHDHGISTLDIEEVALLDQVMSILKGEIRP